MSLQNASGQQREESLVPISTELVRMGPWHQLFTLTTNTEFCVYRAESRQGRTAILKCLTGRDHTE